MRLRRHRCKAGLRRLGRKSARSWVSFGKGSGRTVHESISLLVAERRNTTQRSRGSKYGVDPISPGGEYLSIETRIGEIRTSEPGADAFHLAFGFRHSLGIRHSGFVIARNITLAASSLLKNARSS